MINMSWRISISKSIILGIAVVIFVVTRVPVFVSAYFRSIAAVNLVAVMEAQKLLVVDDFIAGNNTPPQISESVWQPYMQSLDMAYSWDMTNIRNKYLQGMALWFIRDFEGASEAFWSDRRVPNPGSQLNILFSGMAEYQAGNTVKALDVWRQSPDLDLVLIELGYRFLRSGEGDKRYEFWYGAEEINANPKPAKARMYRQLCTREFRNQEWDEALYWCEQSVRAQSSPGAKIMLAHAYVGVGAIAQANGILEDLEKSDLQLNSSLQGNINWLLARIASENNDWLGAEQYFGKAISFLPEDQYLYFHYAQMLLKAGKHQEATLALAAAESLDNGTLESLINALKLEIE